MTKHSPVSALDFGRGERIRKHVSKNQVGGVNRHKSTWNKRKVREVFGVARTCSHLVCIPLTVLLVLLAAHRGSAGDVVLKFYSWWR